jgi:hypothetical protein
MSSLAEPREPRSTIGVGGSRVPPLAAGFHPTAGIDQPDLSLSYVANISFKCFQTFKWYISNFYMDVAKVDRDVTHVTSVSEVCCKCLLKNVSSVFSLMLQQVFSCCNFQVFYVDVA